MKSTFALLLLPVPCTPSSSPPGVPSLARCKDQPKHHFFQEALLGLLYQCAYESFCAHVVPRCPTVTGLSQDLWHIVVAVVAHCEGVESSFAFVHAEDRGRQGEVTQVLWREV